MRTEQEMIAYALEVDVGLLPHIPELLSDLEELGSDAELIVDVLRNLNLPESATVIDLGCGKGAVAVEIADELELAVLGIELFEPFVNSCAEFARVNDVSELCEFRQGDILKLVGHIEPADVVIFAALGDVLGRLDETVGVIRNYAKPGGFIVVSDAFIKAGGSSAFPGFDNYAFHEETVRRLTAFGDTLVDEILEPTEDVTEGVDEESQLILMRALEIARRQPELEAQLMTFAQGQADENAYINANLTGAVWVLQRSADSGDDV